MEQLQGNFPELAAVVADAEPAPGAQAEGVGGSLAGVGEAGQGEGPS